MYTSVTWQSFNWKNPNREHSCVFLRVFIKYVIRRGKKNKIKTDYFIDIVISIIVVIIIILLLEGAPLLYVNCTPKLSKNKHFDTRFVVLVVISTFYQGTRPFKMGFVFMINWPSTLKIFFLLRLLFLKKKLKSWGFCFHTSSLRLSNLDTLVRWSSALVLRSLVPNPALAN